ncbi:MAG: histidine phosphatase family protein [Candidatus Liptonbacteria bacterium]|nr:histidine phosphatase family protein [Candidatus Liptonbacteria bacterium]
MLVYFVRHGESEFNAQHLHQHPEVPLSELGRKQAGFLAERLARVPFDAVLASPYLRAKETALIINKGIGKPIEELDILVELRRPSEIEGRPSRAPEVETIKDLIIENYEKGDDVWRYSDEENFYEFRARALELLRRLESRTEKHILAVSHGAFIKMTLAAALFGPAVAPRDFLRFYHGFKSSNTGVSVIERKESGWRVVTWNDLAHLDHLE